MFYHTASREALKFLPKSQLARIKHRISQNGTANVEFDRPFYKYVGEDGFVSYRDEFGVKRLLRARWYESIDLIRWIKQNDASQIIYYRNFIVVDGQTYNGWNKEMVDDIYNVYLSIKDSLYIYDKEVEL